MSLTVKFIAFIIIAIAVFDFYVVFELGSKESISAYIIRWSYAYPSIPFLVGFVMGHLFWRMSDKRAGLEDEGKK